MCCGFFFFCLIRKFQNQGEPNKRLAFIVSSTVHVGHLGQNSLDEHQESQHKNSGHLSKMLCLKIQGLRESLENLPYV